MGRYLLGRLLTVPPTLLGVSLAIFLLLRFSPGDPAERILSQGGEAADPAAVAALRRDLGLDLALPVQYSRWLGRVATGDFGDSFTSGRRWRWRSSSPCRSACSRRRGRAVRSTRSAA
jgi:ABC-type dipeptide/oligopeptide/nickel transport system permease component